MGRKKSRFRQVFSKTQPLYRDRLDHLLAFVEARPALKTPSNLFLESFYQAKELTKQRIGWKSPKPTRDLTAEGEDREVTAMESGDGYPEFVHATTARPADLVVMRQLLKHLTYTPKISILMPVYNTPIAFLRDCILSVQRQVYANWELCIADDASTNPDVGRLVTAFADRDERIKYRVREKNGHISESSNTALEMATGEFTGLLDHDDMLTPDALFHVVLALNERRDTDMLYSDEDKLTENNERHTPYFKPDWAPETFLSRMFTCHFGVYRTSLVREIGGFRKGFEGSQDYDLVLRVTEKTDKVVHIPRVLYHWRVHEASTAGSADAKPYAHVAARKALQDALLRRHQPGRAEDLPGFQGYYRIRYDVLGDPKVAIIIPTRDFPGMLGRCLDSLFGKTAYQNFEVIVVDNGSVRPSTVKLFEKWQRAEPQRFRVVRDDRPFNFSALCNLGASKTTAELLLFLNNDTEITQADWLEGLLEYAQQPALGAIGAKLLYPNGAIQHCGVVLGLGGTAGHVHLKRPGPIAGFHGSAACSTNVSAVTGACLMVERKKFEQVGGFDVDLAVAYNDVDLCLKLLQAGYRNVVLPSVQLIHHESISRGHELTPEKWSRFRVEASRLQDRWSSTFFRDPYYSPNLSLSNPLCEVVKPGETHHVPHGTWSSRVFELVDVGVPTLGSATEAPSDQTDARVAKRRLKPVR